VQGPSLISRTTKKKEKKKRQLVSNTQQIQQLHKDLKILGLILSEGK
jgi:hypothetical protein